MTPFGELPQWLDMGPDQDFSAPTADLVGLLKKKMNRKSQGGAGSELGGMLGEGGGMSDMKSSGEGMNSL